MTEYRYLAVDGSGRERRGRLQAESVRAARSQLRAEGLLSLRLDPMADRHPGSGWRQSRRLAARQQALFTRQLASLLLSGLPLGEALAVLVEQAEQTSLRQHWQAIRNEVLAGHGLASSLQTLGGLFPPLYCAVIAAGEQSGQLGGVMLRLADYLEARDRLRQKVLLAFIYPIIVSVVALLIVVFLLSYVVPQVVHVFADSGQSLPWLTVLMMAISSLIRQAWPVSLLLFAGLLGLAYVIRQRPRWRYQWDALLLRLPALGPALRSYNTVRFASTLAMLRGAGVSILAALEAAAATMSGGPMQQALQEVSERVREGQSLSRALSVSGWFPALLVHMIRAGEATGQVAEMLERAAQGLADELERKTLFLTSLLEPLLILVMGGVVLLIVLAVMLPIIELNTLVH